MESNTWCENLLLWFISKDSYQYPCLEYSAELFKKDKVKPKVLDYYLSYCRYHTLVWKKKKKKRPNVFFPCDLQKLLKLFYITGQLNKTDFFYRWSSIQIPWTYFWGDRTVLFRVVLYCHQDLISKLGEGRPSCQIMWTESVKENVWCNLWVTN